MVDTTVAEGEDVSSESNDTQTIEIELSEAMLTWLDIIRKLDSVDYTDASRGSALEVLIEGGFEDELDAPLAGYYIANAYLTEKLTTEELEVIMPNGLSVQALKAARRAYRDGITESVQLLAEECDEVADADAIEEISARFGVDPFESRGLMGFMGEGRDWSAKAGTHQRDRQRTGHSPVCRMGT